MSSDDQVLYAYGLFLTIGLSLAIFIPYLRGMTDLLSAGNAFLVGGAIFVGLSSINCANIGEHYSSYTSGMYQQFMVAATLFFAVFIATYLWWQTPRRIGANLFQKWPQPTWPVTMVVIAVMAVMIVARFAVYVPILTSILVQMSEKAVPFAVVVALTAWHRDKVNPITAAVVVAAIGGALLASILFGGGRRTFLGVLLAVPICLYWYYGRNRKPFATALIAAGIIFGVGVVLSSFSMTRRFDLGAGVDKERNVDTAVEQLENTYNNLAEVDLIGNLASQGQNATEVSLYCINRTRDFDAAPFESIYIALANPIPRTFWPDKPDALGLRLVEEALGIEGKLNWGPGIVGHCYNEGNEAFALFFIVFYGVALAAFCLLIDGCVAAQPNNPFLVGILAAFVPHLIAAPRGDISIVYVQFLGAILLLITVQWLVVIIFGGSRPNPAVTTPVWTLVPQQRVGPAAADH